MSIRGSRCNSITVGAQTPPPSPLEGLSDSDKRYALTAMWSVYVGLAALLAARPCDLKVAMALTEVEDLLQPLLCDLRTGTSSPTEP
jgi:hypothetical protein